MDEHELEVYFHEYCGKCEYKDVAEEKDPCHLCLSYPNNTDSHKPIYFKERRND